MRKVRAKKKAGGETVDGYFCLAPFIKPVDELTDEEKEQGIPLVLTSGTALGGDGETVEGTVRYVPSVTDSKNSLYIVEVLVDNADGRFNAGMSAEVEVSTEKQENTITVPEEIDTKDTEKN